MVKTHGSARALAFVAILGAAILIAAAPSQALSVFLDYTNFETRLDSATSSAGVADFSGGEITTIQSNILSSLNTAYAAYDVSFFTTNPGGSFETVTFGDVGGGFGLSLGGIDWRNTTADLAQVFTANFDTFIEAGDPRATQITEISASLAGTAGHELGHNLGLRHYDAYGDLTLIGNASGGVPNTGGLQNTHIMATGSTGLNEAQRETQRDFSDLAALKLEYAAGVPFSLLPTTAEQVAGHGTAGTAQGLGLVDSATSGYDVTANVSAAIDAAGEMDFYSFSARSGEIVVLNVLATGVNFQQGSPDPLALPNSFLSLFDTDGVTLLASNDDIQYTGTSINSGGTTRTFDSLILNFSIPKTGTYYFSVRDLFSRQTGTYDLLVGRTTVIPEPTTIGLLGLGLLGVGFHAVRRRRRS